MSLLNAVGVRTDPVPSFNFTVSLIDTSSTMAAVGSAALSAVADVALGGFSECTGLEGTVESEEYREGGRNDGPLRFPTRATWTPVVLKRGVVATTALWDWHQDFVNGRGKRRDGVIVLLSDLRVPARIWCFRRGMPSKYSAPALDAGRSAVAVETLEIVHEGLFTMPGQGILAGASAAVSLGASLVAG
jgi:phage tail-like protein